MSRWVLYDSRNLKLFILANLDTSTLLGFQKASFESKNPDKSLAIFSYRILDVFFLAFLTSHAVRIPQSHHWKFEIHFFQHTFAVVNVQIGLVWVCVRISPYGSKKSPRFPWIWDLGARCRLEAFPHKVHYIVTIFENMPSLLYWKSKVFANKGTTKNLFLFYRSFLLSHL